MPRPALGLFMVSFGEWRGAGGPSGWRTLVIGTSGLAHFLISGGPCPHPGHPGPGRFFSKSCRPLLQSPHSWAGALRGHLWLVAIVVNSPSSPGLVTTAGAVCGAGASALFCAHPRDRMGK